jgi:dipeptidyl aminopeptidase/acylaminoacyl peptidase
MSWLSERPSHVPSPAGFVVKNGLQHGLRPPLSAWGLVDVEDCVAGARSLVVNRNADPVRLMISGGSAGGYTTLCALTPKGDKVLSAGASYYGVSDLEALVRDTHKFESRYLDWLIGPYHHDRETYAERSPINHVDRLSAPVIFFQGAEDLVFANQSSQRLAKMLDRRA